MFEEVVPNSEKWMALTTLKNEEWKDIPGFEKLYAVSNYGRVMRIGHHRISMRYNKNGKHYPTKILSCSINSQGYVNTQIRQLSGHFKTFKVHRLVATLFIDNVDNKPQVNHIDGNKQNNRIDNLEWCTNGENGKHAWDNGLRKRLVGEKNKFSKAINQFDIQGNYIKTWGSIGQITKELGISHSLITATCQHKQKTSHGYIWKYKEEANYE